MRPEERLHYIGGSDIAAVMGVSRWKSPLQLWAEKTGKLPPPDLSELEHVEIGTELEGFVAKRFEKKFGLKVRVDTRTFRHPVYDFCVAHIDRWIVGHDGLLECKTTSGWNAREWERDEIPAEYVLQVNWYLGIVRKQTGYIACLVGGQKCVYKQVEFDGEMFQRQVRGAVNFWENFVQKDVPPVAGEMDNPTLQALYPESEEVSVVFTGQNAEEIDGLIEARTGGIEVVKDAKLELDSIEARLKQALGAASVGETERYILSWKTQRRAEHVVKASEFRVLRTRDKNKKEKSS